MRSLERSFTLKAANSPFACWQILDTV